MSRPAGVLQLGVKCRDYFRSWHMAVFSMNGAHVNVPANRQKDEEFEDQCMMTTPAMCLMMTQDQSTGKLIYKMMVTMTMFRIRKIPSMLTKLVIVNGEHE